MAIGRGITVPDTRQLREADKARSHGSLACIGLCSLRNLSHEFHEQYEFVTLIKKAS
jgi:hypothetical protein